jgi:hypothetical protein
MERGVLVEHPLAGTVVSSVFTTSAPMFAPPSRPLILPPTAIGTAERSSSSLPKSPMRRE